MLTADHDDFIVEQLREDPEFFKVYCEEAMKEEDPFLLQESFQYIIRAKGFDCNLVIREKENA